MSEIPIERVKNDILDFFKEREWENRFRIFATLDELIDVDNPECFERFERDDQNIVTLLIKKNSFNKKSNVGAIIGKKGQTIKDLAHKLSNLYGEWYVVEVKDSGSENLMERIESEYEVVREHKGRYPILGKLGIHRDISDLKYMAVVKLYHAQKTKIIRDVFAYYIFHRELLDRNNAYLDNEEFERTSSPNAINLRNTLFTQEPNDIIDEFLQEAEEQFLKWLNGEFNE